MLEFKFHEKKVLHAYICGNSITSIAHIDSRCAEGKDTSIFILPPLAFRDNATLTLLHGVCDLYTSIYITQIHLFDITLGENATHHNGKERRVRKKKNLARS